MSPRQSATGLLVSLFACFGTAVIGSKLTAPAIPEWYAALQKPTWTPPAGVFGPVWSVLYLQMAMAAWLAWRRLGGDWQAPSLRLFALQLGLNVGWSALFFGAKQPGLAFAEILLLWGSIAGTTTSFWRWSRLAAALLLPYLLWVTFAAMLNFAVWRANR